MPTQTFVLIGQPSSEYELAFARLDFDFGDGYEQSVIVGHSSGQEFVTLVFNALSNRSAQNITDPEDSTAKTPEKYLIDFFTRRMVDGAAFNVTTTRGATLLVTFADSKLPIKRTGKNIGQINIRFRQHRP
ncbi:MAG: hypothetical protein ACREOR_00185 [Candidatus Binatia bacterium]